MNNDNRELSHSHRVFLNNRCVLINLRYTSPSNKSTAHYDDTRNLQNSSSRIRSSRSSKQIEKVILKIWKKTNTNKEKPYFYRKSLNELQNNVLDSYEQFQKDLLRKRKAKPRLNVWSKGIKKTMDNRKEVPVRSINFYENIKPLQSKIETERVKKTNKENSPKVKKSFHIKLTSQQNSNEYKRNIFETPAKKKKRGINVVSSSRSKDKSLQSINRSHEKSTVLRQKINNQQTSKISPKKKKLTHSITSSAKKLRKNK